MRKTHLKSLILALPAALAAISPFASAAADQAPPSTTPVVLDLSKPAAVSPARTTIGMPNANAHTVVGVPVTEAQKIDAETLAEMDRLEKIPNDTIPFRAQPLDVAITQCASMARMNFVAPNADDFKEVITMRINANPYKALKVLADSYGFDMEFVNGAWRFYKINPLEPVLRIYKVKFNDGSLVSVDSANINNSLATGGGAGGSQQNGPNVNLTGGAVKTDPTAIEKSVKELIDLPITGVELPVEEVGAATDGFKSKNNRPGYYATFKPQKGSGWVKYHPDNNTLECEVPRQTHRRIERLLSSLDQRQRHVHVTATFVTITKLNSNAFGSDWTGVDGVTAKVTGLASGPLNFKSPSATPWPSNAVLSVSDMSIMFKFLRTCTENTGFKNNAVMATNNRLEAMSTAIQFPIQSANNNTVSGVGQTTQGTISYIPIGISTKLVPQIMDKDPLVGDGKSESVRLNIAMTVSTKTGSVSINGNDYPIIDSKDFSYSVLIPNDYTLVISGLRSTDNNEGEDKVPWLGDIPLIGSLFSSKSSSKTDANMMAFLSPHIMTAADYDSDSNAAKLPKIRDAVNASRSELSGVTGFHKWDEQRDKTLLPGNEIKPKSDAGEGAKSADPEVEVKAVQLN